MPLTKEAVIGAAFWDESLCLACGNIQAETDECIECGSTELLAAKRAVALLELLEESDDV